MNVGLAVLAIASSVVFAVSGVALWVKPPRRLASRVRPYSNATRAEFGLGHYDAGRMDPGRTVGGSAPRRLLGPMLAGLVYPLARTLMPMDDRELTIRLRQGGLFPDLEEAARPRAYRMRSLGLMVLYATGLAGVALLSGGSGLRVILFMAAGAVLGALQVRARLSEAVRRRREAIRSELYTINQLVAMYTRVGGGPIQGLRYVVGRARGVAVEEIAEVLHLHDRGWVFADAMERAERLTPEPEAARTYRVMARSQEQGSDLSDALLGLSKDLRAMRRDALRRAAARRRILMVIPVVVVLAPITMLFMAAPIPSIVFGG
ncbi:MAG: type II secretion system F family protein [Acidimicrobiia bacterium]|nr:type II secretion system F family protein [Acidimicrobiia bacterium]